MPRRCQAVGDRVGIDDSCAHFGKHLGDTAFAAADAAGKRENEGHRYRLCR